MADGAVVVLLTGAIVATDTGRALGVVELTGVIEGTDTGLATGAVGVAEPAAGGIVALPDAPSNSAFIFKVLTLEPGITTDLGRARADAADGSGTAGAPVGRGGPCWLPMGLPSWPVVCCHKKSAFLSCVWKNWHLHFLLRFIQF